MPHISPDTVSILFVITRNRRYLMAHQCKTRKNEGIIPGNHSFVDRKTSLSGSSIDFQWYRKYRAMLITRKKYQRNRKKCKKRRIFYKKYKLGRKQKCNFY